MIFVNDELLAEFRRASRCAWCGRSTPGGTDPAHCFSRGAGRLDIRCNIVSLCRECHTSQHAGNAPLHCDLLALVAARHGCHQSDIEDVIYLLRRLPKDATGERLKLEAARLKSAAQLLLIEVLFERVAAA